MRQRRLSPGMRAGAAVAGAVAGLLSCVVGGAQATAQEAGDPASGHRIAQRWCSGCHVVDAVQPSGGANGAPSFMSVAQMASTTQVSLSVFLETTHGRMPDFELTRNEIANVTAYIVSLKSQ